MTTTRGAAGAIRPTKEPKMNETFKHYNTVTLEQLTSDPYTHDYWIAPGREIAPNQMLKLSSDPGSYGTGDVIVYRDDDEDNHGYWLFSAIDDDMIIEQRSAEAMSPPRAASNSLPRR
jgi:hypothetical protein